MPSPPPRLPHDSPQEPYVRPRSIAAVAVMLVLVGALSALAGVTLSAVSRCCGSPDPADSTPALLGLVVAGSMAATGIGLWSGQMSRRMLLLCAGAMPVVVLAVSPSSSDLQGLAPVALAGWLWLWWFLRRPVAARWLDRRRSD